MKRTPVSGRRSGLRWLAAAGVAAGALAAFVAFAPASWLADAVDRATAGRLLLAEARGSIWNGSALPVLTGGAGSRDARALPGRLQWTLGLAVRGGAGLDLRARQDCCIEGELSLRLKPRWGGWRLELAPPASAQPLLHWPASVLAGLGTPFNTLDLGGTVSLASEGLAAERGAGGWHFDGRAALTLHDLSSRLAVLLPVLGSYRVQVDGGETLRFALSTLEGALRLQGQGEWTAGGLRFRGLAAAAPGSEPALNNLLNNLGRRQGGGALLSIG